MQYAGGGFARTWTTDSGVVRDVAMLFVVTVYETTLKGASPMKGLTWPNFTGERRTISGVPSPKDGYGPAWCSRSMKPA